MIPLVLVTGFLGSGKTTLLRRIAQQQQGRRLAFVVNEFSSVDVDGAILAGAGVPVTPLAGGSVFCRCLVTRFIETLETLASPAGPPYDAIVVEASGMANPRVVGRMLDETRLAARVSLGTVLAVIDPSTFPIILETLAAARSQVAAAQRIVLNKCDLHDADTLEAVKAAVRAVNPSAPIVCASHGDIDTDALFDTPGAEEAGGEYAPCRDPQFATFSVSVPSAAAPADIRGMLEAIAPDLYRAKGLVATRDGVVRVDWSGGRFAAEPAAHLAPTPLVLIVRGEAEDRIRTRLGHWAA